MSFRFLDHRHRRTRAAARHRGSAPRSSGCARAPPPARSGNAETTPPSPDEMAARDIADYTDEANAQHYELPRSFLRKVLGPNRKYSCALQEPESTLQEAPREES